MSGNQQKTSHAKVLRAELKKLLPGYKWTVHKPYIDSCSTKATGVITSGFNRCSTIEVLRVNTRKHYEVKIAGFGLGAPWLCEGAGETLAQAVRLMQRGLEDREREYGSLARELEAARKGGAK